MTKATLGAKGLFCLHEKQKSRLEFNLEAGTEADEKCTY